MKEGPKGILQSMRVDRVTALALRLRVEEQTDA